MTEEKYTRCPGCRTIFRVTDEQLALRGGQVRCGHCKHVFDGHAGRISLAPKPRDDAPFHDEARYGPPTITLRSGHSLLPVPGPASSVAEPVPAPGHASATAASAAEAPAALIGLSTEPLSAGAPLPAVDAPPSAEPAAPEDVDAGNEPAAASHTGAARSAQPEGALPEGVAPAPARVADADYENRFTRPRGGRIGDVLGRVAVLAAPLLLLLLIAQAAFHFRDALAAHIPATKPLLVRACAVVGCSVGPLHEAAGLSIDASDLQADPAHRGLLMLTATLRNRSGVDLAYPHLELTLTDAQEQVVVRRVILPAEYVGGGGDLNAGIPGNAEVPVKLFIDASATTQAGYQLYAFYP
jgi:predicted Zn finger-like uncharacterized protein